jgi:hypothetical protein
MKKMNREVEEGRATQGVTVTDKEINHKAQRKERSVLTKTFVFADHRSDVPANLRFGVFLLLHKTVTAAFPELGRQSRAIISRK